MFCSSPSPFFLSIFKMSLWSISFTFSLSITLLNSKISPKFFVFISNFGKISLNKDSWFCICSSLFFLASSSSAFCLRTFFIILILEMLFSSTLFSLTDIACLLALAVPNWAIISFLSAPTLSSSSSTFCLWSRDAYWFCSIFLIFWFILKIASMSYKSISLGCFFWITPNTYSFLFMVGLFLDS